MAGEVIEIFSERPVSSGLGAIKLGFGLFLAGAVVVGLVKGTARGELVLGCGLAALALLGMGAYDLRLANDRRAQVVLTPEGIETRAMGGAVLPWAAVARIVGISSIGTYEAIRVEVTPDMPLPPAVRSAVQSAMGGVRVVVIDPTPLKRPVPLLAEAVARFAPQVPLVGFPKVD